MIYPHTHNIIQYLPTGLYTLLLLSQGTAQVPIIYTLTRKLDSQAYYGLGESRSAVIDRFLDLLS